MKGIKCDFCKRWGHEDIACYSKQRKDLEDELARQRVQIRREERQVDAPPPAENVNVLALARNLEPQDTDAADADSESESFGDKEIAPVKRKGEGEPLPKNPRRENEEETMPVSSPPIRKPSAPNPVPSRVLKTATSKKKKSSRRKTSKTSVAKELGDRVEKYDLMNSFVQTSAGISFDQLLRGDAVQERGELQKLFAHITKAAAPVPESTPTVKTANRHEFALLKAYGKEVYALLYSGAIRNVMSRFLSESLRLSSMTTTRRIQDVQITSKASSELSKMFQWTSTESRFLSLSLSCQTASTISSSAYRR